MLCFMKTVLQRFMSYTLISHTNEHAVRGRPILNDVPNVQTQIHRGSRKALKVPKTPKFDLPNSELDAA